MIKRIFIAIVLSHSLPTLALAQQATPQISVRVGVYFQNAGEKVNKSDIRIYDFGFLHLSGLKHNPYCSVKEVRLHNLDCNDEFPKRPSSEQALFIGAISSLDNQEQDGKFLKCEVKEHDSERWEFTVEETSSNERTLHRMLVLKKSRDGRPDVTGYSGSWSKFSAYFNRPVSGLLIPFTDTSAGKYALLKTSCKSIEVPNVK